MVGGWKLPLLEMTTTVSVPALDDELPLAVVHDDHADDHRDHQGDSERHHEQPSAHLHGCQVTGVPSSAPSRTLLATARGERRWRGGLWGGSRGVDERCRRLWGDQATWWSRTT
jgi:hypothetical protein